MISRKIASLRGKIVVVKLGGNALGDVSLLKDFSETIAFLVKHDVFPVVVHGAGPHISRALEKAGIVSEFSEGYRVTDDAAMTAMIPAVLNDVALPLVRALREAGCDALCVFGERAELIRATQKQEVMRAGVPTKFARVGDPSFLSVSELDNVMHSGVVPVFSSILRSDVENDPGFFNVNADSVAAFLASELRAQSLIFLSNVSGLYRNFPDPDSLISDLTLDGAKELCDGLDAGMIPKMRASCLALESGVGEVLMIDGRHPGALRASLSDEALTGTRITVS